MQIDSRVTNGLAWVGLILVVGVLSLDFVAARVQPSAQRLTIARQPDVFPLPVSARPKPAVAVAAGKRSATKPLQGPAIGGVSATAGAVDEFLASGKPLPSYITGAGSEPETAATQMAGKPTTAVVASVPPTAAIGAQPVSVDPIQVGAINTSRVAPTPMPLSMRPIAVAPLIIDEAAIGPNPEREQVADQSDIIDAQDLADWEYGPLSEFLANRRAGQTSRTYDADGFFLNQGPAPARKRDRVVGRVVSAPFFPFSE